MLSALEHNIEESLSNKNFIPKYIQEVQDSIFIEKTIWGIDLPTTVYLNLIKTYDSLDVFNQFCEKFPISVPYHKYLYTYFVKRCALMHSCQILGDSEILVLKKYVAIFKDFNYGKFNSETFERQSIKTLQNFKEFVINVNLDYIESIYDKNLAKIDTTDYMIFNFPEYCDNFEDNAYSKDFYDDKYELFYSIADEYVKNHNNESKLRVLLQTLKTLKFKGGSKPFEEYLRRY